MSDLSLPNIRRVVLHRAISHATHGDLANAHGSIERVLSTLPLWSIEDREQLEAAMHAATQRDRKLCLEYLELVAADDCPVGDAA